MTLAGLTSQFIRIGALSGMMTVMMGAFGAHMLKDRLAPEQLETWETAVLYQGLHALALVACGLFTRLERSLGSGRSPAMAGLLFIAGTLLFSGSLYGLALGGPRWLGPVTPLGGLAFLGGWLALALQPAVPRATED